MCASQCCWTARLCGGLTPCLPSSAPVQRETHSLLWVRPALEPTNEPGELLICFSPLYDCILSDSTGTQNLSGLSVFSVTPIEGSIAPGNSRDVTVTFLPDHESLHYSDRLRVQLINKVRRQYIAVHCNVRFRVKIRIRG